MAEHLQKIVELQDVIRLQDNLIDGLRRERDEALGQAAAMRENVRSANDMIQIWIDAFNMDLTDKGWSWSGFVTGHHELQDRYSKLLADWNKFVVQYNNVVAPKLRNFGRPLAASPSQQAAVLERRKRGETLRGIAAETGLGLQTVRTILGKKDGTDRATLARLQRIKLDKLAEAYQRGRRRTRDALPRKIEEVQKKGRKLIREAKGLA